MVIKQVNIIPINRHPLNNQMNFSQLALKAFVGQRLRKIIFHFFTKNI